MHGTSETLTVRYRKPAGFIAYLDGTIIPNYVEYTWALDITGPFAEVSANIIIEAVQS